MVHRSRWGWHPCDYATFLLLKELNLRCEQARRQFAAWQRWHRKLPHNRLLRRHIRDDQGRKVGREIIGPMPEPTLPALFCARRSVRSFWSRDGKPLKEGRLVEEVSFDERGIPAAYRGARYPAPSEEAVRPLPFTEDALRQFVTQSKE